MSNQENNRKPRTNRPTDPFSGPRRSNSISLTFTIAALLIFLVLQWTKGDLGNLFGGVAAPATVNAPADNAPQEPTTEVSSEDEQPAAQATVTLRPQQTPVKTVKAQATQTPRATKQPTPTANAPPVARASDLPTVAFADLPAEAQETITLIDQGGPFPYSRDGIVFQNREKLLPNHPQGYYHEYTVVTPGSDDRGARRLVTGEGGELYYSDDHYSSFREIVR
jgi:ribonuclease T1